MSGRLYLTALLTLTSVSLACSGAEDTELRVLRTVVESVAARLPEDFTLCVSTRYLTKGDSTIPDVLMESLLLDGWDLYDPLAEADAISRPPNFPPDTGSTLIFVDPATKEDKDWLVEAAYTETYLYEGEISWAVFDLRYRVSCDAESCEPLEVIAHGHGDGGHIPAGEFFRQGRPRCGRPGQRPGGREDG